MNDTDLQALCEVCVGEGYTFGQISKEIRTESGAGLREAIVLTLRGLKLAEKAGNLQAERARFDWINAHPDVMNTLAETLP